MRILYLGDNKLNSTSRHRADALLRIGHQVILANPTDAFHSMHLNALLGRLHYHTGFRFLQKKVQQWLRGLVSKNPNIDLVWVNGGEYFGAESVEILKTFNCPVILYNNDDPTGGRDGRRFDSMKKAIPMYDLCVVMRALNVPEYYAFGAKKVVQVTMSYDEIIHKGFENTESIPTKYKSEVAFIGTWMPNENRDVFLNTLIERGVPLSIWGDAWKKSPLWKKLSHVHRGSALYGTDYIAAIQGAKICIGLLSKGNRDYYTTRSLEIPYIGGLLCAERTASHIEMYEENKEAIFWKDAEECANTCLQLLENEVLIKKIKIAGHERVIRNESGNEDICKKIINFLKN